MRSPETTEKSTANSSESLRVIGLLTCPVEVHGKAFAAITLLLKALRHHAGLRSLHAMHHSLDIQFYELDKHFNSGGQRVPKGGLRTLKTCHCFARFVQTTYSGVLCEPEWETQSSSQVFDTRLPPSSASFFPEEQHPQECTVILLKTKNSAQCL